MVTPTRPKRLTKEEIEAKEKELGRRLSSTEKGIFGRPATTEEQKRFKKFAKEWKKQQKEQAKKDARFLKAFSALYKELGRYPTYHEIVERAESYKT